MYQLLFTFHLQLLSCIFQQHYNLNKLRITIKTNKSHLKNILDL